MKGVLNAVNEGIITFDSKLRIIMINRHALNLWKYSREELLGKNLSILIQGKGICNSFISPPFNLTVSAQNYLAVSHG